MEEIKPIAVLTRDCSGINALLRAVVPTADSQGIQVFGVTRHFEGLMVNRIVGNKKGKLKHVYF